MRGVGDSFIVGVKRSPAVIIHRGFRSFSAKRVRPKAGSGLVSESMSAESNFANLNLELPPTPKPMGVYKPIVVHEGLAYLSGHGPLKADGSVYTGRVGLDVDQDTGYEAARQTGLAMLATLRANLGSLDNVKRVVKVLGMVNSTAEFGQHPAVINGCSELFAQVFGEESGIGARSAVGMGSLPGNISVEIEGIFEVETS